MGVICLMLVYYVQGQISLVRISYVLDQKTRQLGEKEEHYRQLKYEMEQMKSPRLLENKLSELNFDLTLPKEIRVIRIAKPIAWNLKSPELEPGVATGAFGERVANFFERWVKVAQAKTEV